ncbi:glycerol-3-phosphate acyltransferase PlsY [Desulfonispora thiosulfatigenes DSM 11270]|uniref:Glycerol-3-phosphate acyltransferase n=1 Tax=Desulfonispora thiosulfatigenes DSM 11270 TaxID=656914 RepID=A0A1W1VN19_DESTI|nr:glycerol-3-phosphate 1-O-acyltransferase PlsY [Desulfonispora thiosulfatigenes]SMB94451.1 glycerol-3-phosphate acyltransferase PlsY [Desulfonispora thiosulfatigenes DSM 11270]
MQWLKIISFGYLLGSIPFGLIIGRLYGKDVRKFGSKNIGFTNVWRVIGLVPALLVLTLDALKGYLSVYYGYQIGGELFAIVGAIASVCGHMFPLYLKFKGGKGVATALGVIIFLSPKVTLFAVIIWLVVTFITRYVSLASILAAIFVPFGMYFLQKPLVYVIFAIIGSISIVFKHSENIKKLINRTENKIGSKISISKGGPL